MARPDPKDVMKWYGEAKTLRARYEQDWRLASAYCMPRHYASWQTEGPAAAFSGNNDAAKRYAFDNTGVRSVPKYVAILNRLCTPESQRWHKLTASNPDLMRSYAVRKFFDELNTKMFKMRYQPRARFTQAFGEVYAGLGVYGTAPVSVTWRKKSIMDKSGGFAYKAWPLRDVFVLVDDEGHVSCVFRRFWLNARQFKDKFGEDEAPTCVKAELSKTIPSEENYFEFVHVLNPRNPADYDPSALDARRHPICSYYISTKDSEYVGKEAGFRSIPLLTPRTFTEPGDVYGYSPAMQALPALGGVNAMKKTILKQGHKAVDPVILSHNDGVLSGRIDLRPGSNNPGGVSRDGKALIQTLPTGNFRVAEQLLTDERKDIEDSFFVTLFQILTDTPEMTATEVMERVAEKASLLAPTMGRLQSELLGTTIEREIELMAENNALPEIPPELVEANGDYEVIYTSPLAKGQYAEEVSGFMRIVEMGMNYAQATQDPAPLDWFNFDEAMPDIADRMSVRTSWMNDTKVVELKRENRKKEQQAAMLAQQAPAIASVAKEAMKQDGGTKGVSN